MADDAKSEDLKAPEKANPVELSETDLAAVAGGASFARKAGEGQKDFMKVTMKEVFISGRSSG